MAGRSRLDDSALERRAALRARESEIRHARSKKAAEGRAWAARGKQGSMRALARVRSPRAPPSPPRPHASHHPTESPSRLPSALQTSPIRSPAPTGAREHECQRHLRSTRADTMQWLAVSCFNGARLRACIDERAPQHARLGAPVRVPDPRAVVGLSGMLWEGPGERPAGLGPWPAPCCVCAWVGERVGAKYLAWIEEFVEQTKRALGVRSAGPSGGHGARAVVAPVRDVEAGGLGAELDAMNADFVAEVLLRDETEAQRARHSNRGSGPVNTARFTDRALRELSASDQTFRRPGWTGRLARLDFSDDEEWEEDVLGQETGGVVDARGEGRGDASRWGAMALAQTRWWGTRPSAPGVSVEW